MNLSPFSGCRAPCAATGSYLQSSSIKESSAVDTSSCCQTIDMLNEDVFHAQTSQISLASLCDTLNFSHLWDYIFSQETTVDSILSAVEERRQEIKDYKLRYTELLTKVPGSLFLQRVEEASSGVYLYKQGKDRFILKPFDEGMYCLNHPKKWGSPFSDKALRPKSNIPPGRTVEVDYLCSFIAEALGIAYITPKVERVIVTSDHFFDISQAGNASIIISRPLDAKEKLCSMQPYIEGGEKLTTVVYNLLSHGSSLEEVWLSFNAEQMEDLHLFLWCCYDTDAHLGNFMAFSDEKGSLQIRKIDNSFCFPDTNEGFTNHFMHLIGNDRLISERLKQKMLAIPVEMVEDMASKLGLQEPAIAAFAARADLLKRLATKQELTFNEVNLRMYLMEHEAVKQDFFSQLSTNDLEKIVKEPPADLLLGDM
jgi:hypothetical protein